LLSRFRRFLRRRKTRNTIYVGGQVSVALPGERPRDDVEVLRDTLRDSPLRDHMSEEQLDALAEEVTQLRRSRPSADPSE